MASDDRLLSEPFPRSSKYHPDWIIRNGMTGTANTLWLTEWLAEAMELWCVFASSTHARNQRIHCPVECAEDAMTHCLDPSRSRMPARSRVSLQARHETR